VATTSKEPFLTFPNDAGCFGCSAANPSGLGLKFQRHGEEVEVTYTVPDHFHGAPAVVHGGIVAAMLDEVSCAAVVFVEDQFVVTGELTVRYVKPVPVGEPLTITGRVVDRSHPKYLIVEAHIEQGKACLARSSGKFFIQERQPADAIP
jgi:uncharacterized protein (TIGR00369 family)